MRKRHGQREQCILAQSAEDNDAGFILLYTFRSIVLACLRIIVFGFDLPFQSCIAYVWVRHGMHAVRGIQETKW